MSSRKVDIKEFAKELGVWNENRLKELRQAVVRGVYRSLPDLVAASPVDTGLYAQSWQVVQTEESVVVGNTAPYAGIIEYGARPFTPPLPPLLAWAKRVLTGQKSADGSTIQTGQPESDYSPEVWALAKYVQKKISERGIEPRHVMENTLPTILANIKEELRNVK